MRRLLPSGKADDWLPIKPGDRFVCARGYVTTPYPKQKSERYASDWLQANAVASAKMRGDISAEAQFTFVKPTKRGFLPDADREGMLDYLCAWEGIIDEQE